MVAFKIDRNLQTITNYYLLSLAVADFLIGCISMPLSSTYILARGWPLGPVACDMWLAIDYLNSNASVLNLLLISFDRYFSVTRPLTYRAKRTTRKACLSIAFAWIISALLWPPWIFAWPSIEGRRTVPQYQCYIPFLESNIWVTTITALLAFWLPVTIMCVFYWQVWRETANRYRELTSLLVISPTSKHKSSSPSSSLSTERLRIPLSSSTQPIQTINSNVTPVSTSASLTRLTNDGNEDDDDNVSDDGKDLGKHRSMNEKKNFSDRTRLIHSNEFKSNPRDNKVSKSNQKRFEHLPNCSYTLRLQQIQQFQRQKQNEELQQKSQPMKMEQNSHNDDDRLIKIVSKLSEDFEQKNDQGVLLKGFKQMSQKNCLLKSLMKRSSMSITAPTVGGIASSSSLSSLSSLSSSARQTKIGGIERAPRIFSTHDYADEIAGLDEMMMVPVGTFLNGTKNAIKLSSLPSTSTTPPSSSLLFRSKQTQSLTTTSSMMGRLSSLGVINQDDYERDVGYVCLTRPESYRNVNEIRSDLVDYEDHPSSSRTIATPRTVYPDPLSSSIERGDGNLRSFDRDASLDQSLIDILDRNDNSFDQNLSKDTKNDDDAVEDQIIQSKKFKIFQQKNSQQKRQQKQHHREQRSIWRRFWSFVLLKNRNDSDVNLKNRLRLVEPFVMNVPCREERREFEQPKSSESIEREEYRKYFDKNFDDGSMIDLEDGEMRKISNNKEARRDLIAIESNQNCPACRYLQFRHRLRLLEREKFKSTIDDGQRDDDRRENFTKKIDKNKKERREKRSKRKRSQRRNYLIEERIESIIDDDNNRFSNNNDVDDDGDGKGDHNNRTKSQSSIYTIVIKLRESNDDDDDDDDGEEDGDSHQNNHQFDHLDEPHHHHHQHHRHQHRMDYEMVSGKYSRKKSNTTKNIDNISERKQSKAIDLNDFDENHHDDDDVDDDDDYGNENDDGDNDDNDDDDDDSYCIDEDQDDSDNDLDHIGDFDFANNNYNQKISDACNDDDDFNTIDKMQTNLDDGIVTRKRTKKDVDIDDGDDDEFVCSDDNFDDNDDGVKVVDSIVESEMSANQLKENDSKALETQTLETKRAAIKKGTRCCSLSSCCRIMKRSSASSSSSAPETIASNQNRSDDFRDKKLNERNGDDSRGIVDVDDVNSVNNDDVGDGGGNKVIEKNLVVLKSQSRL
ncbi:Muscarinic acetylcholine receptor DM1 [Sarcoptes scabiei]|uniref:Muscarinic acetylcholine receptor DM1 n=1 Tax=Sarcoptes scabiei TaxID=52283 RepID=A0A834VGX8_SARSC|nr:Muscarinic acetylcholine receptor DM1 [Sarcoptes scabiei]